MCLKSSRLSDATISAWHQIVLLRKSEQTPESEKPRRWKSEVFLANDPSTGMDAALSQILPKIKSPAIANWLSSL